MPQSLARNVIHLIFSTKNREPFILTEIRDELLRYLTGTLNALKCPTIKVGGVADHVHIFLFCLSRTMPLSKVVEEVKKSSSKWMKEQGVAGFYWQNGYGAFSVSPSNEGAVKGYIGRQEEHHKTKTFQEEYREFLKKHNIEWDERYVWD
jgi:putative transposase